MFYEDTKAKWINLSQLQKRETYKNIANLFEPDKVYGSIVHNYDIMESTWLELLVATGHTRTQLLDLLYEGKRDGQGEEDLPLD